jgi:hypothetical protein
LEKNLFHLPANHKRKNLVEKNIIGGKLIKKRFLEEEFKRSPRNLRATVKG